MHAEPDPWHVDEREFPFAGTTAEKAESLIRYAVLAASVRNSQPWRFAIVNDDLELQADPARWLAVADPARGQLTLSLGCALENLLVAAERFGLGHCVSYFPDPDLPDLAAVVSLSPSGRPSAFRPRELFGAIVERRTDDGAFSPRPVPEGLMERLRACRVERGLGLILTADTSLRREVDYLLGRADAALLSDEGYREELGGSLRDGSLHGAWLLAQAARLAAAARDLGLADRAKSELLQGAPVIGFVTSDDDEPASLLRAGQLLERLALTATSLGLSLQPVGSLLSVPDIVDELHSLLPGQLGNPLAFFRLGEAMSRVPHTGRRPLHEVLGPPLSVDSAVSG